MKIEKPKHDHKLTDLLKVCIFSLLMLAPLIASCSQWLYATINKNAHESYYGETINQNQIKQINYDNLLINNTYSFINNAEITAESNTNQIIAVNDLKIENNVLALGNPTYTKNEANNIWFYVTSQNKIQVRFYQYDTNVFYYVDTGQPINVTFTLISKTNRQGNTNLLNFEQIQYINYSYLDNAFYYGVDQMTKSELFNWTQNTALYSGIKAMTDNLQIQTNAIAILLTYWFILTIIYIIVDIVLKLFTTMTHLGTKD